MPMAGEGSRFLKEGWTVPKPLIELNGVPLFMHSIRSLYDEEIKTKQTFIVRLDHIEKYTINERIKSILPTANIFSVEKTTRGAVETSLIAEPAIEDDEAIIILDCDLEFKSADFLKIIKNILSKPTSEVNGGALVSFESKLPKYSYAEIDTKGWVIRTAEKEVISTHALCGAYFFATGKRFKEIAHQLLNDCEFNKPEYYVSLLYNYMLSAGEKVKLASVDEYYSYGTPEELQKYFQETSFQSIRYTTHTAQA